MNLGVVAQCEGPVPRLDEILANLSARSAGLPRIRQKLSGPFGELGPYRWVEDDGFRLENHLHHQTLPQSHSSSALEGVIGDIFSRDLDRSKPLWELWLVDGLSNGGFALVSKVCAWP